MAIDFAFPAPDCGESETRPAILYNVHYTYYGIMALVITSAAIIIISYITERQPEEEVNIINTRTTFSYSYFFQHLNFYSKSFRNV